jgi:ABC-type branched-subunit amino acid transport system substrate-binding protein
MKKILVLYGIGLLLLLAYAYGQPKVDKKAELYFNQGKNYFEKSNFSKSLELFELALRRKFNLYTTPSLYMKGLCYFYLNNYNKAIHSFEQLLKTYPESIYAPEAVYHKALLMLTKEEDQTKMGGLYLLMNIVEDSTQNNDLREDAHAAIKNFFFNEASTEFIENYLKIVRSSFRSLLIEALAMRAYAQKNVALLKEYINFYQKENHQPNPRLNKLLIKGTPPKSKTFNIAFVVHLGAGNNDSSRGPKLAAQLLAGSQLAVEMQGKRTKSKIHLRVFDTQGEALVVEKIINEDLPAYKPYLVIGDIFNSSTKIIADYAEKNKILHIVPFSLSDELIEQKKYVLLANPSFSTQMQALVSYLNEKLKLKKFLIITDGKKVTNLLTQMFQKYVKQAKLTAQISEISDEPSKKKRFINRIAEDFRNKKFDAIYIPITNENFLIDLLYELKNERLFPQIIGAPDWVKFKNSTKKLLSEFNAISQDLYYPRNDSLLFEEFTSAYDERFKTSPTRFSCQGFDIIHYVIKQLENVDDTTTLLQVIRKAPPFKGLVQNYYFAGANDNQSVQILRYHIGGVEKLKRW